MAKATANCTCATCGAQFTRIKRDCYNRDAANSWEAWAVENITECDDCRATRIQREQEEANAAAAKEAEAAGLPKLTGTEKQVAWANTLRKKVLDKMYAQVEKLMNAAQKNGSPEEKIEAARSVFNRFLGEVAANKVRASWWIDNQSINVLQNLIDRCKTEWEAAQETPDPAESELRKAAEEEMTAAPENQTHDGAVEITVTETAVSARYEKNDDFRAVVKGLGFRWDADSHVWQKHINFTTGKAQERAAELGNHLLNDGFAVRIADPETREKAITGDYTPEHRRWIAAYTSGDYKGWFAISLPERGDGMYEKARAIKGSRYCKPYVAVPAKRWREVADFAEMYDYKFVPHAQEIIDREEASIIVVTPAPVKAAVYDEHRPEDLLADAGTGVLADLMED